MAELEDHAIRRDRGFLVRLVLGLCAALVFGLFVFDWLTGDGVMSWAARTISPETPPVSAPP